MENNRALSRSEIASIITLSIKNSLLEREETNTKIVDQSTPLIGVNSILDSLGLVTLLVDLEQKIDGEYGLSVTLADDRALSQKNSPFRTVNTLTDYVYKLVEEMSHNVEA
jgi:acyl carrier protein